MKRLVMVLLIVLFCMINTSYAGNGDLTVGGALEMTSSANGFLPPRMTTSNRGNLSPSPGMLIYNTDDNAYNYYTSSGWKTLAAGLPVYDNTGASVDYPLAVGETAKITFSGATSVPLHIATAEGDYEIKIIGNTGFANAPSTGWLFLSPNNTTYSNQIYSNKTGYGTVSGTWSENVSYFGIGESRIIMSYIRISTRTANKNLFCQASMMYTSGAPYMFNLTYNEYWNNTSTVWDSLGTLIFPFAQSGTVIIRRLL